MNAAQPVQSGTPAQAETPAWRVRDARAEDAAQVATAVARLLVELGGTPPAAAAMETTALALIEDAAAGLTLVADTGGELVGVLSASWQTAIHVAGRYVLIQDLWVDPAWRSNAVGAALVSELCVRAREAGVPRVEVGLPREDFTALAATRAFYDRNGFDVLGVRMRRVLT